MVCCVTGRFGCCDPAAEKPEAGNFAYTLFVLETKFAAIKVDLSTGTHTDVSVPGYNDWSEITRIFTYDAAQNLFYLLQTDFIDNPEAPQHKIILYTINPVSGSTTNQTVQGCEEEGEIDVPGFAYNYKTKQIVMSTQYFENNQIGYKFYTLNPQTAVATQISSFINSTDSYVGWFDTVAPNGTTVYRLGYKDVYNQVGPGLGITDISTAQATHQWRTDVPIPSPLQFYQSFTLSGDKIISLAPDASGNLHLVQWQVGGSAAVLAKFGNAHKAPVFGPIVEFGNSNQTQYTAVLVQNNLIPALDKWALVVVDLPSGNSKELSLSPTIYAGLSSVSGLGVPV